MIAEVDVSKPKSELLKANAVPLRFDAFISIDTICNMVVSILYILCNVGAAVFDQLFTGICTVFA